MQCHYNEEAIMGKHAARNEPNKVRFVSQKSPDYRLEFVNGAFSSITPRGEIICNFIMEYKDIPIEQSATVPNSGPAMLSPFVETPDFTRDVKFGVIMNVKLAKDLIRLLGDKIKEAEANFAETPSIEMVDQ
jgi:hypothetical protein